MGIFDIFKNESNSNKSSHVKNEQYAKTMAPQWLKIVHECVELVNKTTTPEVFFERYDLLIENLEKLVEIENLLPFKAKPSADLKKIKSLYEVIVNNFIDRYTSKLITEIHTLTTEKAKEKRLNSFFEFIPEYIERFTERNVEKAWASFDKIEATISENKMENKQLEVQIKKSDNKSVNIKSIERITNFVSNFQVKNLPPGSFNWVIAVSFGKTTSRNLPNAIFVAKQGLNFSEEEIDGSKTYTVEYTDSREDFKKFIMLYDIVGKWKSTAFFVNGEMLDKRDIAEIKWCYGDKCTSVKSDFCYGASEYTANPFGCHRLQISTYNNPWWNYYTKNGNKYVLLKEELIERINLTYSSFRHCPAFDKDRILSVANSIPLSLTINEYEKLIEAVNKYLGYYQ